MAQPGPNFGRTGLAHRARPILPPLVAAHIKEIIKAQFTFTTTAIQASVIEKLGYEISYKKALDGKHKELRQLFGAFSQSCTEMPCLFLAIE